MQENRHKGSFSVQGSFLYMVMMSLKLWQEMVNRGRTMQNPLISKTISLERRPFGETAKTPGDLIIKVVAVN